MAMSDLLSDFKFFTTRNSSKVKANGSFVVAKTLRVKCTIMEGPNGLFCGLPGNYYEDKTTKEKKWGSQVDCVSKDVSQEFQRAVLAAYQGGSTSSNSQGSSQEPESQVTRKKSNLPF